MVFCIFKRTNTIHTYIVNNYSTETLIPIILHLKECEFRYNNKEKRYS